MSPKALGCSAAQTATAEPITAMATSAALLIAALFGTFKGYGQLRIGRKPANTHSHANDYQSAGPSHA